MEIMTSFRSAGVVFLSTASCVEYIPEGRLIRVQGKAYQVTSLIPRGACCAVIVCCSGILRVSFPVGENGVACLERAKTKKHIVLHFPEARLINPIPVTFQCTTRTMALEYQHGSKVISTVLQEDPPVEKTYYLQDTLPDGIACLCCAIPDGRLWICYAIGNNAKVTLYAHPKPQGCCSVCTAIIADPHCPLCGSAVEPKFGHIYAESSPLYCADCCLSVVPNIQ